MTTTHPLKLAYARDYPGELATFLATRGTEAVLQTLDDLPAETAAPLVAMLPHRQALEVQDKQDDETLIRWLNAAGVDHALTLLLHIEESRRARILQGLPSRRMRRTLEKLVIYPPDKVGALADPSAMQLNAGMLVPDAVALLHEHAPDPEQPVWLVDDGGGYLGRLDLGGVLMAKTETAKLSAFLMPVEALRAETRLANARDFPEWLRHTTLPVTDHLNHLLGSLSREALMVALRGGNAAENSLGQSMNELTGQYFRVMGICLEALFGVRGK
ncbi:magnesium transporter MgtE N-terminal domain-containing protein [Thiohalophilus sp.]|uniref:magnesium transporter MgtE N-terminal domain-containing protein n=1 Tax=Thiohalophilus sp. TaxID=3028392 RepID=UPI002ACDFDA3|nr:hypothetical protein [Thiohalophilus sp.]MDZ7802963.1 hypothetical protein [Thiohalophilus sp.]